MWTTATVREKQDLDDGTGVRVNVRYSTDEKEPRIFDECVDLRAGDTADTYDAAVQAVLERLNTREAARESLKAELISIEAGFTTARKVVPIITPPILDGPQV